MARIPCVVKKDRDGYRPYVTFSILQPKFYITVDACVDTGSPVTVLSPRDALTTRLPLSAMRSGPTSSLAGFTFFRHDIGPVGLRFRTEDDKLLSVGLSSLSVLVPTKTHMDKETQKMIGIIPSLVGTDLLREQRWKFHYDPAGNESHLETP